ncbi:unnamed protein product [Penicillium salamii]|nr:unnamed protein product [Penicillium salamii]
MDEAVKLGYHPLDFNFGILKPWVLILTMVVWSAVIGGVVALTIIGRDPSVLHIHSQSNYYALRYGPSVIGTITSIWWRAITQSYNRIIPYVVMANMDLEPENGKQQQTIMGQSLNYLYRTRHWVTLIVNLSFISILILVLLKSSFVQITRDSSGWGVNVQPVIGWMLISFYLI